MGMKMKHLRSRLQKIPTQTPQKMTFDLATRVSLGMNQLKLKDGQQPSV